MSDDSRPASRSPRHWARVLAPLGVVALAFGGFAVAQAATGSSPDSPDDAVEHPTSSTAPRAEVELHSGDDDTATPLVTPDVAPTLSPASSHDAVEDDHDDAVEDDHGDAVEDDHDDAVEDDHDDAVEDDHDDAVEDDHDDSERSSSTTTSPTSRHRESD